MDILNIEILEDGGYKIETDKVSMANHTNAEGLIRNLVKDMGGQANVQKRKEGHVHHHHHDHVHDHHHH